jgi:hypothetical protein
MSTETSTGQTGTTLSSVGVKQWVLFIVFVFIVPLALFLAAGRLDWWTAWAYVVIYIGMVVAGRVIAFQKNPGLIAERAQLFGSEGVKS